MTFQIKHPPKDFYIEKDVLLHPIDLGNRYFSYIKGINQELVAARQKIEILSQNLKLAEDHIKLLNRLRRDREING